MFAEPQTITVNAVAVPLPRIQSSPTGVFSDAEDKYRLTVAHNRSNRLRTTVRLDNAKIAADPLTAENADFQMSCQLAIVTPLRGYTVTEAKQIVDALTGWLTATSGANVTKLLGKEL